MSDNNNYGVFIDYAHGRFISTFNNRMTEFLEQYSEGGVNKTTFSYSVTYYKGPNGLPSLTIRIQNIILDFRTQRDSAGAIYMEIVMMYRPSVDTVMKYPVWKNSKGEVISAKTLILRHSAIANECYWLGDIHKIMDEMILNINHDEKKELKINMLNMNCIKTIHSSLCFDGK
jgi:hypothetical protein